MGFAPTWLRQVSPPPCFKKTTLTTALWFDQLHVVPRMRNDTVHVISKKLYFTRVFSYSFSRRINLKKKSKQTALWPCLCHPQAQTFLLRMWLYTNRTSATRRPISYRQLPFTIFRECHHRMPSFQNAKFSGKSEK